MSVAGLLNIWGIYLTVLTEHLLDSRYIIIAEPSAKIQERFSSKQTAVARRLFRAMIWLMERRGS
jgi:hypothetical protein